MPTQIVVAIDDPSNIDAWGLRPYGAWSAGSYPKGAVVTHANSAWMAQQNTTQTPGAGADWLVLVPSHTQELTSVLSNLPTTLPNSTGVLWNNGGVICIS